jgi:hypothetical protein
MPSVAFTARPGALDFFSSIRSRMSRLISASTSASGTPALISFARAAAILATTAAMTSCAAATSELWATASAARSATDRSTRLSVAHCRNRATKSGRLHASQPGWANANRVSSAFSSPVICPAPRRSSQQLRHRDAERRGDLQERAQFRVVTMRFQSGGNSPSGWSGFQRTAARVT